MGLDRKRAELGSLILGDVVARLLAGLLVVLSLGSPAPAAPAQDIASLSDEQLIDRLTTLDDETPGLVASGDYETFMAEDARPRLEAGLLPVRDLSVPPPMRELVRRGVYALPALLAHLRDARPTRISVTLSPDGTPMYFGGQFFDDEYDPRYHRPHLYGCYGPSCRSFDGAYTIKVGDVCQVIVGQIVNRDLSAVRYQPTLILYVDSPIESPSLADAITRDWGGLTAREHQNSLISDLDRFDNTYLDDGAFRRLRFYYPQTYAALSGRLRDKRDAFEAYEAQQRAR